jgi:hypothetical protein
MSRLLLFAISVLVVACVQSHASAQDLKESNSADAAKNADIAARFAAAEVQRYKIVAEGDRKPLAAVEQPVLRWSNPTTGEVYGTVFLWTRNGCPEAATSIYQWFDREQINAELVSLSEMPLKAERSGRVRWSVPEGGLEFKTIADAPPAGETPDRRRLQMRSIAREFSARLATRDDEGKFSALRLMSRPLLQYEATDDSGREGAVFAFVTTNDPELLLLVESRPGKEGREWKYAAARMNYCRLQLVNDGKPVWEVPQAAPPWEPLRGPEGSYVILEWKTLEEAAQD